MVNDEYKKKLSALKKFRFLRSGRVSKKDLIALQSRLYQGLREGDKKAILGMSFVTQAIKLEHVITLLETQGITVLEKYWKKLRDGKSKSNQRLIKNKNIRVFNAGSFYPKGKKKATFIEIELKRAQEPEIRLKYIDSNGVVH